jgi:uncharacterized membrane protein
MLAGQFALAVAAVFFGAAFAINFAEQPARLALDDRSLLAEWKPAYKRGFAMQAPLATIGFILGIVAWWQTGSRLWLLGALVLITNLPYSALGIMPTNNKLMAVDPVNANLSSRKLIERWARLHAVRTVLGFAATLIFVRHYAELADVQVAVSVRDFTSTRRLERPPAPMIPPRQHCKDRDDKQERCHHLPSRQGDEHQHSQLETPQQQHGGDGDIDRQESLRCLSMMADRYLNTVYPLRLHDLHTRLAVI